VLRLTRTGVAALLSIPVLVALAWLFGQPELAVAAAAVTAVMIGSSASVRRRPALALRRSIRPARVTIGDPCDVSLELRNDGRSRTSVLRLRDDVGPFGRAVLHLAPLRRSGSQEVAYALPTQRRGLHPVGPLTIESEDPFGLFRRTVGMGGVARVIVLPRTWPLHPMPPAPGDDAEPGLRHLMTGTTVEEEFATIRPYEPGDDIRRIHWRTTARVGRPMVRQYDLPWQRRSTVVLDARSDAEDPSAFERAVSAAASVVELAARRHEVVRLLLPGAADHGGGFDSGEVAAADRLDELLDRLAAVRGDPGSSMAAALGTLGAASAGAPRRTSRLVTVSARIDGAELSAWERSTGDVGLLVLVSTSRSAPVGVASTVVVHWDGGRGLSETWNRAMDRSATPSRAGSVMAQ